MTKQVVYKPTSEYNKSVKTDYTTTAIAPKRTGITLNLNTTDGTTVTTTAGADIILTGLFITGGADAGCSTYANIYINNEQILVINNGVADANDVNLTYIPFPDWLIKKGDVLKLTLSPVGGAVGTISVNFICYYAFS